MPLPMYFSSKHTQAMHIKPITHNNMAMFSLKPIPIPWRDPNPGPLFLRRVRCPLRHAARAFGQIHI
jgi:hypothetical protein